MLNVAEVAPAAMVIDAGTVADVLLELSITNAPPEGAAVPSVTVQTLGEPPTTDVGLSESVNVLTAVTVRTAVAVPFPDSVAEIVALVLEATVLVVTENVADVAPAATVTDAGTEATLELLVVRAMVTPPEPAADERVTVPVEAWPPVTVDG